jgi:RHS repeat-associated protein
VTSETIRAGQIPDGQSCGETALTANANYDRGLSLAVDVLDLHGEPTRIGYDGLGRVVMLTRPSPYVTEGQPPGLSAFASVKIEYLLPDDWTTKPYSILHTMKQDGADHSFAAYEETWGYFDGLGRTLVTIEEADPSAGDGGAFIARGLVDLDAKGTARRSYLPFFFDGDPTSFPLSIIPPSPFGRKRYDAFERELETFGLDGSVTLRSVYHGLSEDKWDAADLEPGPHQGTPGSLAKDGHDRAARVSERIKAGGTIEERQTISEYLPTGEVFRLIRRRVGKSDPDVVRWMRYDSLGRIVLNAEPHTTKSFHSDPGAPIGEMRAWRYAYNDAGDLVGTSDARGCGANYAYDAAGRILAEDYSPCLASHEDYSPLDLSARTGAEVLYHYDDVEAEDLPPTAMFPVVSSFYLGRLAWVADRASRTVTRYDGRGRVTGEGRQIAKPGPPASGLSDRYAATWYVHKTNFDAADRPIRESTGAAVPDLLGATISLHEGADPAQPAADNRSVVTTEYTARGMVRKVSGSYGDAIARVQRDADGLVNEIRYGDVAATTTGLSYDNRRRLRSVATYRGPPALWTTPVPQDPYDGDTEYAAQNRATFQLLIEDQDFTYDAVDNPTEILDWRLAEEWSNGTKPVTKKIEYDDLYRTTEVRYQYPSGDDAWTSPFAAENSGDTDPRHAAPSPHTTFDKRVQRQTFAFDWLGNLLKTTDDASAFYDRSLGAVTNNSTGGKPYQLAAASNEATAPTSLRKGNLSATYDDAGNLVRLMVIRRGPCLPAKCSQQLAYDWDEVGRLVQARRWDFEATDSPPPLDSMPSAALKYGYDRNNGRVIKSSITGASSLRSTLYVFSTLELRRASAIGDDYERAPLTEVPYLISHGIRLARVAFEPTGVPSTDGGKTHVFLEMVDHLGSTSTVLDKATGELVERTTYEAYGATESDYRPARWGKFREDYRFTGKEDDDEVGLAYFGMRFYAPMLGQWVSPDPLTLHTYQGDLNLYAYVKGQPLRAVDPFGLQPQGDVPPAYQWDPSKPPPPPPEESTAEKVEAYVGVAVATALVAVALFSPGTRQAAAPLASKAKPVVEPLENKAEQWSTSLGQWAQRAGSRLAQVGSRLAQKFQSTKLEGLSFTRDEFSIKAYLPSDPKVFARIVPQGNVLNVTDIFSGNLPAGSGSQLLAQTLQAAGAKSGQQIIFKGIQNVETMATFNAGGSAASSLLGHVGRNALEQLGLKAASFQFQVVKDKLELVIGVE